jgi:DNA polymerase elongation subunit (family B)
MKDKSSTELWDYSEEVADKVTKLFPPPISLEFEEAIYDFFFILTKKRYMYRAINSREGKVDEKIGKKGVLLARRDNSKFVRDIYEGVITRIADDVNRDDVIYWILKEIQMMFAENKHMSDFIITKSVGNCNNCQAEIFYNEKNEKKAKVGDYTTPLLSSEPEERLNQMKKKNVTNTKDFYLSCLPAQVQLAERMKRRGQRVDAGSRIEYLVSDPINHTGKQYNKIESYDYYKKHSSVLKIDYFYYLKALTNPLDQVLNVAYGKDKDWIKDMILNLYNFKYKIEYKNTLKLNELFRDKLDFE